MERRTAGTRAEWEWRGLVRDGGSDRLAANDTLKPHHSHEPCDGAEGDVKSLPLQFFRTP